MSDISDLSSDSVASSSSWNPAFETTFDDFLPPLRSPIPQNLRQSAQSPSHYSQSSNQFSTTYQSFPAESLFVNESYEWRPDTLYPPAPTMQNNVAIHQSVGSSIHNLGPYPYPEHQSQTSKRPRSSSEHSNDQITNQSNNQSSSQSASRPLSEVIAAAQSITVPTLTSMNLTSAQTSSKRKRRNSPERSSNESSSQPGAPLNRAEVKKQKHREIDAVRRQREANVIARLQELNAQHTSLFEQAENSLGDAANRSTSPTASRPTQSAAKDKVSVLEESADKMAALQELCRKLSETCAKQQESINHLTDHVTTLAQKLQVQADDALTFNQTSASTVPSLATPSSTSLESSFLSGTSLTESEPITAHFSTLPPRVQEYLGQMDRSFALYSSCFLQATVCIMIISVKTGRLIDANSCFFRTSGWTPDQVVGRVLTAPIEFVLGKRPTSSLTDVERLLDEQTRPLVRRNGQLVPARRVPQYPRSKQKFKDLVMGLADQIEVIWRSELADGNMYEVKNICYSGKRETVEDERGRVSLRPVHVVFACSALDGIKLT